MRIHHLPDEVLTGAHPRARLLRLGVTRHQLDGADWRQTEHDRWAWAKAADNVTERIRQASTVLPGQSLVSGWAAAHLWGAVDLDGERHDGGSLPVPITVPRHVVCRRHRAVEVFRSTCQAEDVDVRSGIPVTSAVRTAFDLARLADDIREAVAQVDALLRAVPLELEQIAEYVERHRRSRGVPQARRVLTLASSRARSCQESRMRMMWVLDAGLPPPLVNVRLMNVQGHLLGMPDLFDEAAGLVGEYDGRHHASAVQRSVDSQRQEAMEGAGLLVVRLTAPDLITHRLRSVFRIKRLHARGLARDRTDQGWVVVP